MARKTVERNVAYDDVKKKFYVNLDYGLDDNGKQRKKTKTFAKISDARKALKEHEANKVKGMLLIPQNTTLNDWLLYWLENIVAPNKEATTLYAYQQIIENHISPALGKIAVQSLSATQVQRYYTTMQNEKKLSTNTIRKHHDLLNNSLKMAVKQDILLRNPIEKVEPPKIVQKEIAFYTSEDMKKLFNLVHEDRLELVVKLAGYLGLRREEICGLCWDNINFDTKIVTIQKARTMAGSAVIEKKTKNKTSTRTLYLPDELVDTLKNEKIKQDEAKAFYKETYANNDYVIVWDDGKPYRPNYISELFTKFITDKGLPKITLHGLRHTFATLANSQGISLFDIGKALGHSTTSTTGKIYTHMLDITHEDTIKKISSIISNK